MTSVLLRRGGVAGRDRDDAVAAAGRELHRARGAGVQRVVAAHADALAGLEAAAALADDDLAAGDGLAGEHLHAEALRVRVAAVAGRAEALLVCHYSESSFAAAAFLARGPSIFVTRMRVSSCRWPARRR